MKNMIISLVLAVAAVIGIKMLELPALVNIVLIFAVIIAAVFGMAGGFSKKKASEGESADESAETSAQ